MTQLFQKAYISKSRASPGLYHIPNENIDPELSFRSNFSLFTVVQFFRLSPKLEYANEIKDNCYDKLEKIENQHENL